MLHRRVFQIRSVCEPLNVVVLLVTCVFYFTASQITNARDSEAITDSNLVKGHAYSITGVEQVSTCLYVTFSSCETGATAILSLTFDYVSGGVQRRHGEVDQNQKPMGTGGVERSLE